MDSCLPTAAPVKPLSFCLVAALFGSLATGCVHNDWPATRTSFAPNQLVANEENLFDESGGRGERAACDAKLVRIDFADSCLRCGGIDVALDGTRLGRAAPPHAPSPMSHAWARPKSRPRAPDSIPSFAVSVDPSVSHRIDFAPTAASCAVDAPSSGRAAVEATASCDAHVVEVRCTGS